MRLPREGIQSDQKGGPRSTYSKEYSCQRKGAWRREAEDRERPKQFGGFKGATAFNVTEEVRKEKRSIQRCSTKGLVSTSAKGACRGAVGAAAKMRWTEKGVGEKRND